MDGLQQQIAESDDRREFFYKAFKAISFNQISGDYAEFGCHGGRTFRLAYLESRGFRHACHMWAFDSFAGLPPSTESRDVHPRWTGGSMSTAQVEFERIIARDGLTKAEYSIVKGWFEQSLNEPGEGPLPSDICLAYIDCDLYSSTKHVLNFLTKRLKHGMIIALDDYYCYSASAPSGERVAFAELAKTQTGFHFLPYAQYGWHGMSFIVEHRSEDDDLIPGGISF